MDVKPGSSSRAVALSAGLVGACLGSVATWAMRDSRCDTDGVAANASAAELERAFRAALDPLRKTMDDGLAALRAEVRQAHRTSEASSAPGTAGADPGTRAPFEAPSAARGRGAVLSPPREDRLDEIKDWNADGAVRRKWLFSSEAEVLERFGAPDGISVGGGTETWEYWTTRDGSIVAKTMVVLASGRVVRSWIDVPQVASPLPRGGR